MPGEDEKKSAISKYLPVIIVVVGLAYAIAAYFLLFMPKISDLMAGGALDTRPLEARLKDYQAYLDRITREQDEFNKVNSAYKSRMKRILPEWADGPNLYVQMDQLARSNGMLLSSIDAYPAAEEPGPHGVRKVRVSVSLAGGTLGQFMVFLEKLERLARVSDIESMTFSSGDTDYSVILTAYYIDEAVAPAQAVPEVPDLPQNI